MKLSIGMATYDDFDGVYFTVQSLRLYHDLTDCEILVVDNKPDSAAGQDCARFLAGLRNCRYIPMPTPVGTAAPRNRVFSEARGEAVLCLDCHVLLAPSTVSRLKAFYDALPEPESGNGGPSRRDLFHGPIVFDPLTSGATHFDDYWRGEMWGIWGQAWECNCREDADANPGNDSEPLKFSVLQDDGAPNCRYVSMELGSPRVTRCPRCNTELPILAFAGHEAQLDAQGYTRLGRDPEDAPFRIPGQGLGLFTCRKDAWLGFNEQFRGFGGEELYVHTKFRAVGADVWCLPFLQWNHRFGRPAGVKFPLTRWHKVRNYVLGAIELAGDDADEQLRRLKPIEEHFVETGLLPREQWEAILADPSSETVPMGGGAAHAATRPMPPTQFMAAGDAAEGLLSWCTGVARDINEHLPKLAELASRCDRVTEFSGRRESTVGLLAGVSRNGGRLISYQTESDALLDQMRARFRDRFELHPLDSPAVPEIAETDLLFLDTSPHNFDRVWGELTKFAASTPRYIVLHDTVSFGDKGEGGGDGLWEAMRRWIREHDEWFVAFHTPQQYGLTVLSRNPDDRPEEKIVPWPLGYGPGTELKKLLAQLGIMENPTCDCNAKARQMDTWGIDGCREHFDEIVDWMREGQSRWGWKDKLSAAAKAVATGIAFKINWSDPFPGLIELAIERAEEGT